MSQDSEQPPRDRLSVARDRLSAVQDARAALFEALACTAEGIALTLERNAEVHDNIVAHLPGAAEHAARSRRFAAAERAAASAYRNHELPSQEVRQAIRESRPGVGGEQGLGRPEIEQQDP